MPLTCFRKICAPSRRGSTLRDSGNQTLKPAPFSYVRARNLSEAVAALAAYGGDAKVLAGGQSLLPSLNLRLSQPEVIIDINCVSVLEAFAASDEGWSLGSLVRHSTAENIPGDGATPCLLRSAASQIGHLPVRHRGSIGGSLAHADPAAEWPAIALVCAAELEIRSARGERREAAASFFRGPFATSLDEDELLIGIRFPPELPGTHTGFAEVSRRPGDFAFALAAAYLQVANGRIGDARLAVAGLAGGAARCSEAESALVGERVLSVDTSRIAAVARATWSAFDDAHSSSSYKLKMGQLVVEDALRQALDHAVASEMAERAEPSEGAAR